VLIVWWLATVVLRGSALRHSQPTGVEQWSKQAEGDRVEGNRIHEVEMMDQMMDPQDIQHRRCPNSSDTHTLANFNRTLYRWRGKTITIAGDSLTDNLYEALVCSGILLGAKLRVLAGYGWPNGVEEKWLNPHLVSGRAATHPPFRMNQLVFDWGGELTIQQIRFYDFDNDGNELSSIFEPKADLLLVNLAHEAYKAAGQDQLNRTRDVTKDILKKAAAQDVFDKLVLFGHPPQHFDTKTGEYESKEQAQSGLCRCHDDSAMKGQASWKTNSIMSEIAHAHHVPYVEPWPYYAQACKDHLEDHDCTHFKGELSLHAKFVEKLLLASKR
jgi:hypothetical protein